VIRRKAPLVVVGWINGRSDPVGAVLLAAHDADGALAYCGTVSSGLSRAAKRELFERLQALEEPHSPLPRDAQRAKWEGIRWARPQLVGLIAYREFAGRLRHPAWHGLLAIPAASARVDYLY
jgi:bifunctional non-homologous end joining protein LigD